MLQLLDKKEISKRKSEEDRKDIEEAVKLKKAIESLRELRQAEEASLEKWRSETLAVVQKEIDDLIKKRDQLKNVSS